MPRQKNTPEYTVEKENGSVWVNGKFNCLGRFTPLGFEIYRNMGVETEVIGTTNTVHVRVKNTDAREWSNFKELLRQTHNIDLGDMEYPSAKA